MKFLKETRKKFLNLRMQFSRHCSTNNVHLIPDLTMRMHHEVVNRCTIDIFVILLMI